MVRRAVEMGMFLCSALIGIIQARLVDDNVVEWLVLLFSFVVRSSRMDGRGFSDDVGKSVVVISPRAS